MWVLIRVKIICEKPPAADNRFTCDFWSCHQFCRNINTNPGQKIFPRSLRCVWQFTCDRELRALNISKKTKQVKVMVVSRGVITLSCNWKTNRKYSNVTKLLDDASHLHFYQFCFSVCSRASPPSSDLWTHMLNHTLFLSCFFPLSF